MGRTSTWRVWVVACALCCLAAGQQITVVPSPRQAVIEMISGGPQSFRKHLTVEVQNKLKDSVQPPAALGMLSMVAQSGGPNFQSYDSGRVLFSVKNPQQNETLEVRVDNDYLHGDLDEMELSFHSFRNGKEEDLPIGFHIVLGLKQQESVWRLNAITFDAKIPVGDPKLYDSSIWAPAVSPGQMPVVAKTEEANPDQPKLTVQRSVRLITLAEDIYARTHPEAGFTCKLADLVNIGKGMDENSQYYSFMPAEFAVGSYNGYRFNLSGCEGKPASAFSVTAEPLAGSGKAYCSDSTHTLKVAADGHATTCLNFGVATLN
jgi:hypothetical protein